MSPSGQALVKGITSPYARPIELNQFAFRHKISTTALFTIRETHDGAVFEITDLQAAFFSALWKDLLIASPHKHHFKAQEIQGNVLAVKFVIQWMAGNGMDPTGDNAVSYPQGIVTGLKALKDTVDTLQVVGLQRRVNRDLAQAMEDEDARKVNEATQPAVLPSPSANTPATKDVERRNVANDLFCKNCWSNRHDEEHGGCPLPVNQAKHGGWRYMPANQPTPSSVEGDNDRETTAAARNPYLHNQYEVTKIMPEYSRTARGDFTLTDQDKYEWKVPLKSISLKFVGMVNGQAKFEGEAPFEYAWADEPETRLNDHEEGYEKGAKSGN